MIRGRGFVGVVVEVAWFRLDMGLTRWQQHKGKKDKSTSCGGALK